mmetsp:Transcript_12883/g.16277  ORF Transcript_12883/g.16277 Transcript_12883/m.16277 type:complete len:116 (-) Transcript_12883:81-428(-)
MVDEEDFDLKELWTILRLGKSLASSSFASSSSSSSSTSTSTSDALVRAREAYPQAKMGSRFVLVENGDWGPTEWAEEESDSDGDGDASSSDKEVIIKDKKVELKIKYMPSKKRRR